MTIGERIWNLGRLFNLREGVEADDLPEKLYAEESALSRSGPSAGKAIGEQAFRDALQHYYGLRGWDENGVPDRGQAGRSGVDVRLIARFE